MKFTVFNPQIKTYLEFVAKMESETHPELLLVLDNSLVKTMLRFIQTYLPAKRIEEWIILETLFTNLFLKQNNSPKDSYEKYVDYQNKITFAHACETLSGKYYDTSELKTYHDVLCSYSNENIQLNQNIIDYFSNENKVSEIAKEWILDTIQYSIHRYGIEFGRKDYGFPFFKLYQEYSMRSTAPLCLYTKIHSSFRGQGLITSAYPNYFIFVNLHKDADVKESINYKDKFKTPEVFQWQSPNTTKQSSDIGMNLIYNQERHVRLHLFVRKFEEIEGITQPFMYLGEVITHPDSAEGEKPITMLFTLENRVPEEIYQELTDVVKIQQENS